MMQPLAEISFSHIPEVEAHLLEVLITEAESFETALDGPTGTLLPVELAEDPLCPPQVKETVQTLSAAFPNLKYVLFSENGALVLNLPTFSWG